MPLLQIKSGATADTGRKLTLDPQQPITIGRAPGNALVLADNKASRQHADVRSENGGFLIADRGSSFGTLVNGQKIDAPATLKHGDEIMIGTTCLVFLSDEKAAPHQSEAHGAGPAAAPPAPPGQRLPRTQAKRVVRGARKTRTTSLRRRKSSTPRT